ADGEPERRPEPLADLRSYGTLGAHRASEIAVQHADREAQELLGQRLVEPQVLAHERDRLGGRVGPGGEACRSAGEQMDEQEHQHADQKQRGDQAEKALDEVLEHRRSGALEALLPPSPRTRGPSVVVEQRPNAAGFPLARGWRNRGPPGAARSWTNASLQIDFGEV